MVIVTGMHRSGTSLLCQMLRACGVSFGADTERFPSDRWNASGYFELVPVMDVNSRLITGWSRNHSRLTAALSKLAYLRMPGSARIAARAHCLRPAVIDLSRRLAGTAVKDPRFCLTLRHWHTAAPVDNVIVCVRDPVAVVASLWRRNRLPAALGQRFYHYHVEELLRQVPLDRTLFVDMDALAVRRDPAGLDAVRHWLGIGTAGPASMEVLHSTLRDGTYRSENRRGSTCPSVSAALWERLLALAEEGRRTVSAG